MHQMENGKYLNKFDGHTITRHKVSLSVKMSLKATINDERDPEDGILLYYNR